MERFVYDLRHAWRGLRHRPLFTAVACLSIAIGIGANTTIFSVVNALFLRPPAGITRPDEVVEVTRTTGGRGRDTFGYPEFLDLRREVAEFEHLAGWLWAAMSYADDQGGQRLSGMAVSHNYFAVMGLTPRQGRFFVADEDRTPLTHPVAVVSESFWRTRLAADPQIVGRTIQLNRRAFTVVGIAPEAFASHIIGFRTDVWVPMMMMGVVQPGFNSFESRRSSWFMAVARLKPGVSAAQAAAAARVVFTRMPNAASDPRQARSAAVDPIGPVPAAGRGPISAFVAILLALTGLILLVTCANVAGMLLARAAAREREIAVRLALGSTRGRLIRQLVMEAMLLFTLGGAAGALGASFATRLLSSIPLPTPLPFALDLSPDLRVLVAGLVLALLTGLLFGLAPALQATRPDLASMMKAFGFATGRGGKLRRVFVTSQVAFSMVLLLAAGLFLRSLQRAGAVPTGFEAEGVHAVQVDLSTNGYNEERGQQFVTDLLARLGATRGVSSASTAEDLPLDLNRAGEVVWAESPAAGTDGTLDTEYNVVSPGYFETLGIGLARGRAFEAADAPGSDPVVVVSRTFASRIWPGDEALGKSVRLDSATGRSWRVVGVVDDVKNSTLMEPPASMLYVSIRQRWSPRLYVVVREAGTGGAEALRRTVRAADPNLSLAPVQPLTAIAAVGLLPQRLAAVITTALGALALLLSALGVYGVIAFSVTQRIREIGVRMALGAEAGEITRLVLKGGLRLVLPGMGVGLLAGLGLSLVIRGFVLGVSPGDPLTFVGIPALLVATVVLACWIPARRAAAVEPTTALRSE